KNSAWRSSGGGTGTTARGSSSDTGSFRRTRHGVDTRSRYWQPDFSQLGVSETAGGTHASIAAASLLLPHRNELHPGPELGRGEVASAPQRDSRIFLRPLRQGFDQSTPDSQLAVRLLDTQVDDG